MSARTVSTRQPPNIGRSGPLNVPAETARDNGVAPLSSSTVGSALCASSDLRMVGSVSPAARNNGSGFPGRRRGSRLRRGQAAAGRRQAAAGESRVAVASRPSRLPWVPAGSRRRRNRGGGSSLRSIRTARPRSTPSTSRRPHRRYGRRREVGEVRRRRYRRRPGQRRFRTLSAGARRERGAEDESKHERAHDDLRAASYTMNFVM